MHISLFGDRWNVGVESTLLYMETGEMLECTVKTADSTLYGDMWNAGVDSYKGRHPTIKSTIEQ